MDVPFLTGRCGMLIEEASMSCSQIVNLCLADVFVVALNMHASGFLCYLDRSFHSFRFDVAQCSLFEIRVFFIFPPVANIFMHFM